VVIARGTTIFNGAVEHIMADLRDGAPEDTGATRRGITKTPAGSPPLLAVQVASKTPQGEWYEEGTKPHVILPVRGKVLVFKVGGDTVFTRRVDHPGQRARPWFRPVMNRWSRYLAEAAR
jgi:hypothetical protein